MFQGFWRNVLEEIKVDAQDVKGICWHGVLTFYEGLSDGLSSSDICFNKSSVSNIRSFRYAR